MTKTPIRDKIAYTLSNFILRSIATQTYQERLTYTYALGLGLLEREKQRADNEPHEA